MIVPSASAANRITGAALTTAVSRACAASSSSRASRSAVMSMQMPWLPVWPGTCASISQTQIQAPSRPSMRYSMSIVPAPNSAASTRSRSSGCSLRCQISWVQRSAGTPVQASICGLMYVMRLSASQT